MIKNIFSASNEKMPPRERERVYEFSNNELHFWCFAFLICDSFFAFAEKQLFLLKKGIKIPTSFNKTQHTEKECEKLF